MLFSTLATIVALGASFVTATPTIVKKDTIAFDETPTGFDSCTNATFSWSSGDAPFYFAVYKADGGLYLEGTQNDTSATWLVNAAGGKEVSVQLYDANGVSGSLLSIPVTNGTDTSCVVCASFMGTPYC